MKLIIALVKYNTINKIILRFDNRNTSWSQTKYFKLFTMIFEKEDVMLLNIAF